MANSNGDMLWDEVIDIIQARCNPEDIFDKKQLSVWAESNGYKGGNSMEENVTLDIDGNAWCLKNEWCLAEPACVVGFGDTINEAMVDFKREFRTGILGNLRRDIKPELYNGFVGISCGEVYIDFVGYKHSAEIMLVKYQNGKEYHYYDVPQSVWQKLLVADSKGRFLAEDIKGRYRFYHANGA
jgi:hypothetical protein